jgi:hypothetical protein
MKKKISSLYHRYKQLLSDLKKDKKMWNDVPFLQGIIIGLGSQIRMVEKENMQLKNNEGVWLSPEDSENLKRYLKKIKDIIQ